MKRVDSDDEFMVFMFIAGAAVCLFLFLSAILIATSPDPETNNGKNVAAALPSQAAQPAEDCKDLGRYLMRCIDTELNVVCYYSNGISCFPLEGK